MPGKKFAPNEIDFNIGRIVCMLRQRIGMSQKDLACQLGVTFQQVQKYETAGNRISASRLFDIARALDVPVSALYNEANCASVYDKTMRDFIKNVNLLPDADRKILFALAKRMMQ